MAETNQAVEEKTGQENQDKTQAQNIEYPQASQSKTTGQGSSIDILLDMDVPVTAVIGQTEIPVKTLLQLGPGSVLLLDKSVDAPVELYLRETKFATGTIVVVENNFAVRINKILGFDDEKENQHSKPQE
ncbi:MAG: FliM/FliN family flagellar motor switch protein [Sedimentisphaerales bacterium]|nr:FliM/FliN family flagellar motor switch protein [Sedimentisphaerales bacterium]